MKRTTALLLGGACLLGLASAGLAEDASPDTLRAEIDAIRAKDPAWREIAWQTCLLDGLARAGKEGKPALLWVFIDRPADDARC